MKWENYQELKIITTSYFTVEMKTVKLVEATGLILLHANIHNSEYSCEARQSRQNNT